MSAQIANALANGFTADQVLDFVMRQFPKHTSKIKRAISSGFTAEQILRHFTKSPEESGEGEIQTEHAKTMGKDIQQKENINKRGLQAAALAAATAGGAYALGRIPGAVQGQVLPALAGQAQLPQMGGKTISLGHMPMQVPPNPTPTNPTPQGGPTPTSNSPMGNVPNPGAIQPVSPPPTAPTAPPMNFEPLLQKTGAKSIIDAWMKNNPPDIIAPGMRGLYPKMVKDIEKESKKPFEEVINEYIANSVQNPPENMQNPADSAEMQQSPEEIQSLFEENPPESEKLTPTLQGEKLEVMKGDSVETPKGVGEVKEIRNDKALVSIDGKIHQFNKGDLEVQPETEGNLAILPNGDIGEVESEEGDIAKVNVNGDLRDTPNEELEREPAGVERAVRQVLNSIPESKKSSSMASMVMVPQDNMLLIQFHDGKWAWYKDFPEHLYKKIAAGMYEPKTQGKTGIAEYKPGVIDSRGAGFDQEIRRNPKYSKDKKGETWGYADNDYSLLEHVQPLLHKLSKEKYDSEGNLITPKKKKAKK